ncbi:MAG: N-acetylmuramoyl-L-alanine amidase [Alphaproteobacteria bacterium]|nr:N-acetylmuramoyl-L-alanine amidase [Alphaproteobacteria bacterium]
MVCSFLSFFLFFVYFFSFFFLDVTLAFSAERGVVLSAEIVANERETRFVLSLDKKIPFRVFTLSAPYRVIIDLPEIEFRLLPESGRKGDGLITAYRYGFLSSGRSRVVLDINGPVLIDSSFALEADEGQPARLVFHLKATNPDTFRLHNARREKMLPPRRIDRPEVPFVLPAERPAMPLIIVIDPGHGGVDPGAVSGNSVKEKDITLSFSKELASVFRKKRKYTVFLTRERDVSLSLSARVAIARNARADIFISVHADKFHSTNVRGATLYTLSEEASDVESAALAREENKADAIAGLDLTEEPEEVSDILIDLARRETKNFSIHLARTMVASLKGEVVLNKNPHRFAGFRVLTAPDVPSILLELGYLSNETDVRDMRSLRWREKVIGSVQEAVDRYFSTRFAEPVTSK